MIQKHDKALGYHTQELEVYQELSDLAGECRAMGTWAAVYMALGKYMAFKCYEEQLDLGQKLKDPSLEAQVYGNMGITKMNMNVMEEAIGYFEQQLAMLQQLSGNESVSDRGRPTATWGIATRPWRLRGSYQVLWTVFICCPEFESHARPSQGLPKAWEMTQVKMTEDKWGLVNLPQGSCYVHMAAHWLQSSSTHRPTRLQGFRGFSRGISTLCHGGRS